MIIVLVWLVVVFAIIRNIYESKTNKKNNKLRNLAWAFTISAVALFFVVSIFGSKTYVEEYAIPIHNVQDFRVKMTESYATWDNAYGETYIVPKESVEVKPFPDADPPKLWKISAYEKYECWDEWASICIDFGLFGSTKSARFVSRWYRIECPESQVIISQKSNRETREIKVNPYDYRVI